MKRFFATAALIVLPLIPLFSGCSKGDGAKETSDANQNVTVATDAPAQPPAPIVTEIADEKEKPKEVFTVERTKDPLRLAQSFYKGLEDTFHEHTDDGWKGDQYKAEAKKAIRLYMKKEGPKVGLTKREIQKFNKYLSAEFDSEKNELATNPDGTPILDDNGKTTHWSEMDGNANRVDIEYSLRRVLYEAGIRTVPTGYQQKLDKMNRDIPSYRWKPEGEDGIIVAQLAVLAQARRESLKPQASLYTFER